LSFDNLIANERYRVLVCIIHTIMWPSRKKAKKKEAVNAAPSDLMPPLPKPVTVPRKLSNLF
jgi:hypothetical protein